jgi:hypothetical protein
VSPSRFTLGDNRNQQRMTISSKTADGLFRLWDNGLYDTRMVRNPRQRSPASSRGATGAATSGNLSVPERLMLFCLASNIDWIKAGITSATARTLLVKGLIDREHMSNHYVLTERGRAALDGLLERTPNSQP